MVNVEAVADDIVDHLRHTVTPELHRVASRSGLGIPLAPVKANNFFIGDPMRYRGYTAPVCFVAIPRTNRPGEAGAKTYNDVRYQEHPALIMWVLEGNDEELLTRACYRYAEMADACLHDQDITRNTSLTRSTKLFVTGINYGPVYMRGKERIFRKDVTIELLVKHWDLIAPMALRDWEPERQPILETVLDVVDQSSTTAPWGYVSPVAGNYVIYVYFRVSTSATDISISAQWSDSAGGQSAPITTGTHLVGSYNAMPLYIDVAAGTPIAVFASASVPGQLTTSVTITKFA